MFRTTIRATLRTLFQQHFQYGFWRVAVLRKHRMMAGLRQLVPALAALGGASLLLLIIVADWLEMGAVQMLGLTSLAFLGLVYFVLSIGSSITSARRQGWDLLPVVPVVFAPIRVLMLPVSLRDFYTGLGAGFNLWVHLASL